MENLLANLIIKRVYSAITMHTEEGIVAERFNRPCWAVLIKYEGETVYESNGKTYISNVNNPVILPKGSNYTWQCVKTGHYLVIEFDCDLSVNEIFSFHIKNSEKLLSLFKSMEYGVIPLVPELPQRIVFSFLRGQSFFFPRRRLFATWSQEVR